MNTATKQAFIITVFTQASFEVEAASVEEAEEFVRENVWTSLHDDNGNEVYCLDFSVDDTVDETDY